MRIFFLLMLSGIMGYSQAQDSAELVRQANMRIDDFQKKFQSDIAPKKMDRGVKDLLTHFITKGTDSIQQQVTGETGNPFSERLLALNAHAGFLDAFRYAIVSESFETYHVRDTRDTYLPVFDAIRHYQPFDDLVRNLGPQRMKLMASAFKVYPEGKRLRDMTIIRYAQYSPERIPGWLSSNLDFTFADSLLLIWANRAPSSMMRYVKSGVKTPVQEKIRNHPNPLVQTIVSISEQRLPNNYLPFALQIAKGETDYAKVDALRQEPRRYFQAMVDAEMKNIEDEWAGKPTYYRIPLREYLKETAVKFYVNVMNSRHEETNNNVRYGELNQLRPQDIYMVIVHGEDNFYTSSYLYTYYRLMDNYKKTGHDSLMRFMHRYQARKFIQLAGRYNTLAHFISNMPRDTMLMGTGALVYGLERNVEQGLEEAMTVAETFPSFVRDSSLRDFMRDQLTENYNRCKATPNFYGMKLYTLLGDIYNSVEAEYAGKGEKFSKKLAAYLDLPHQKLRSPEGTVYQRAFFYGDEDGKASFQSFMNDFQDKKQWEIEKNNNWVTIRSKQQFPTVIFANLPLDNERYDYDKDAMDSLSHYLDSLKIEPHVLIHRGHSYHLSHSVTFVTPVTNLAILGSCGGYQEVFSVQAKSPDAQVISTKQVGSKMVNEPLLMAINRNILEEKDIHWVQLWDELDKQLKKDKKAYAYFVDYVPPHKNIGLLVSKIYHDDGDLQP